MTQNTITAIWDAYAQVYEAGDEALDMLIGCPHYNKWLEAEMSDEYLAAAQPFVLEMIRAELEQVVGEVDSVL
jgi:hypothetical protein